MSDLFEVNRNISVMNAQLQTLTDQVATLAVSMDSLIQAVERSERSAERMGENIERSIERMGENIEHSIERMGENIERSLDRITQSIERSERVAERNANTVSELVGIVNRLLAEREQSG